jgi:hypothetical protein
MERVLGYLCMNRGRESEDGGVRKDVSWQDLLKEKFRGWQGKGSKR